MSSIFQPTSGGLPVGTIVITARKTAPEGWMICDGRAVHPDSPLGIALIEDGWPYGDDKGIPPRPQIPYLRERTVIGSKDETYPLGDRGGAAQVTLTTNQMPAHNHGGLTGFMDRNDPHLHGSTQAGFWSPVSGGGAVMGGGAFQSLTNATTTASTSINHAHEIFWQGGSQAHDNMPPYIALNYIIKAEP